MHFCPRAHSPRSPKSMKIRLQGYKPGFPALFSLWDIMTWWKPTLSIFCDIIGREARAEWEHGVVIWGSRSGNKVAEMRNA